MVWPIKPKYNQNIYLNLKLKEQLIFNPTVIRKARFAK